MGLTCSCTRKNIEKVHGEVIFRNPVRKQEDALECGNFLSLRDACLRKICGATGEDGKYYSVKVM